MKKILPILSTYTILLLMISFSYLFNEKEIIFPEIAAICIGSFLSPTFTWNTNKPKILICIMLCALLSIPIISLPIPLFIQITLGYLVGRFILYYSKTSFAPMVSAIVLPILLQTRSPIYLLTAFCFTSLILIMRSLLERYNILEKYHYTPRFTFSIKHILLCTVIVFVMSYIALTIDYRFMIAPPLLVAFTEFSNPSSKAMKSPIKTLLFITSCAFIGSISRILLPNIIIALLVSLTLFLIIMYRLQLFIPPSGALLVLSMLIPSSYLIMYPIHIFIGCFIYIVISKLFFHKITI